jgi:hypothetical protein
MVILEGNNFDSIWLSKVSKSTKTIDPNCFEVKAATSIGISFGN